MIWVLNYSYGIMKYGLDTKKYIFDIMCTQLRGIHQTIAKVKHFFYNEYTLNTYELNKYEVILQ